MSTAGRRLCGSRAKYVAEKCRCEECRRAHRDYERWRTRQQAYGRSAYIDADPVRAHLATLAAQGLGWKRAAGQAGLAESTVWKLLYGHPGRGRAPSKRVRRRTAAALLRVTADLDQLGAKALVPAHGTQRRLRALVALGWAQSTLAHRMGMQPGNFGRSLTSNQIVAETARRARGLYDELWDTPPTEKTPAQRQSAARARNMARARGWTPPMGWDDETIDDPCANADLKHEAHRPRLDLAEVEHLASGGAHITEIARRTGVTAGAIERARSRARGAA